MKKLQGKKLIAAVAVLTAAVMSIISLSLAWLTSENTSIFNFGISNFKASAQVTFNYDGSTIAPTASNGLIDEQGLYVVSTDPAELNYIGNLRVKILYEGSSSSYLRVRMVNQWESSRLGETNITQMTGKVPFKFNSSWFDNRAVDNCMYYTSKVDFDVKDFIVGLSADDFDISSLTSDGSTLTLRLSIQVDVVQVNRYGALWGIDKLPWTE